MTKMSTPMLMFGKYKRLEILFMMTLRDFLDLSMDDCYEVNIFYNNTGVELLHQVEVGNVEEELEKIDCSDILDNTVGTWDIGHFDCDNKDELTINVD